MPGTLDKLTGLGKGGAGVYPMEEEKSSPLNSVAQELESLRKVVREALESYAARLDGEISQTAEVVQKEIGKKKIADARMRDARDMLTLLRNTQIKVDKGRRKDLKKIESLVEDLAMLTERW